MTRYSASPAQGQLQFAHLPFSSVNVRGSPGYDPGLQRHHLLPRQVLKTPSLGPLIARIGPERLGFHDFRRNGILLPSRYCAALRVGLPLHRGPHRDYNAMVLDRLGRIEAIWARQVLLHDTRATAQAARRVSALQLSLRQRILDTRTPLRFHRADPLGAGRDFTLLDRLADELWSAADAA